MWQKKCVMKKFYLWVVSVFELVKEMKSSVISTKEIKFERKELGGSVSFNDLVWGQNIGLY